MIHEGRRDVEISTVWGLFSDKNMEEHMNKPHLTNAFLDKDDAIIAADSDHEQVDPVQVLIFTDEKAQQRVINNVYYRLTQIRVYSSHAEAKKEVIDGALAKLTTEERAALGY